MIRSRRIVLPVGGELFIAEMERAQAEGNLEFVGSNMPQLERLIQQHMDRSHELAQLQQRARDVRHRHEPQAT